MARRTPLGRTLDCMIVGAQKCGTTSIKEYLGAHPEVATHPGMEFRAFSCNEYSKEREAEELGRLLRAAGDRLALAKNADLYTEPFGLDRLSEACPDCKVLLVLRDPVARARSAYGMYSVLAEVRESFDDTMARSIEMDREGRPDQSVARYLHMGCYGKWLGEILRRFPRENVRVIFLEELREDPLASYEEQCRWLGLDPAFSPDLSTRHNIGGEVRSAALARVIKGLRSERNPVKRAVRRALPDATYLRLTERIRTANRASGDEEDRARAIDDLLRQYFASDTDELSRLLDRDVPWHRARSAA
jgi:hypothetical protein